MGVTENGLSNGIIQTGPQPGPASANRRPCCNCASQLSYLLSPPLPFLLFPSPPLPSPSLPFPSLPVLKPAGVRGGVPAAVAFCCIACSQNASGCSISGSLVNIAMSGKMKTNPGSGRIWSKMAPSLKSAALFGRTPRACLRLALLFCVNQQHASIHQPTQYIQIYTVIMFPH